MIDSCARTEYEKAGRETSSSVPTSRTQRAARVALNGGVLSGLDVKGTKARASRQVLCDETAARSLGL